MATALIEEALREGQQHHMAGRLAEAEAAYRRVLAADAGEVRALHLLGIVMLQRGEAGVAVEWIQQAVARREAFPEAWNNLGLALQQTGRGREAVEAYQKAIGQHAQFAAAYFNLGNALRDLGRAEEAEKAYRQAVEIEPGHAGAWNNLGNLLRAGGKLREAVECHRRATAGAPNDSEMAFALGSALLELGEVQEAMAWLERAIALAPNHARACNALGTALGRLQRVVEAIPWYERASRIDAGFLEARRNLADALQVADRLDEAIVEYQRMLERWAGSSEIWVHLGNAYVSQGHVEKGRECYLRAMEMDPGNVDAHSNWLFRMHYLAGFDAQEAYEEHKRWAEVHVADAEERVFEKDRTASGARLLRVGYLSRDFWTHPVTTFMESLLAFHDRERGEVFCYADGVIEDATTERLKRYGHAWRRLGYLSNEHVLEMVRADAIDVLVDLGGHTNGERLLLFGERAAPIQVTYLGYPNTTGLSAMDYRLTDAYADPIGADALYSEKLTRLPETFLCYRAPEEAPAVTEPPVMKNGFIRFGSFNYVAKITEKVVAVWARILKKVEGSRLLIKGQSVSGKGGRQRLMEMFEREGIAAERIELRSGIAFRDHLALYGEVDVALDTFPYNGTTTTCEALWMGVPVVTIAGDAHVSRVGVSLLSNVGLTELIAGNAEEYVRVAVELARDRERLAGLRLGMRERLAKSSLMDGKRFARNVEAAYAEMWRKFVNASG